MTTFGGLHLEGLSKPLILTVAAHTDDTAAAIMKTKKVNFILDFFVLTFARRYQVFGFWQLCQVHDCVEVQLTATNLCITEQHKGLG
tara:strand:- start:235 stop:495 length:261 start_codon:yes stop_codon:yes gene_type:complete